MILIGDKTVPYENIEKIDSIADIKDTKPNSTVIFDYDAELLHYCLDNSIVSGAIVSSLKEAIYANALGARFIIAKKELAKRVQKAAENYMFDAKVLAVIESSQEIEEIVELEIDGIIYKRLIK